jgi:hypothetical protein
MCLLKNFVLALGLIGLMVSSVQAAGDKAPVNSGFLGDDSQYSQLEEVKIRKGQKSQRWISPSLAEGGYKAVLVEDAVLYPKPEPGPQVSAQTLDTISDYLTSSLKIALSDSATLADSAGEGVLKMETAITAVEIATEGMKAYEILPVAAVFGAAKAAAGKRDMTVVVHVEVRLSDSVSGEVIGLAVRKVEGEDLKGKKDQLTLKDMQKNLDQAVKDAADTISGLLAVN